MLRRVIVFLVASGYALVSAAGVAFLVGFIITLYFLIIVNHTHPGQIFYALSAGNREALGFLIFIGIASMVMAIPIALLVGIFIGLPLYLASRRLRQGGARLYALVGCCISLLVCGILVALTYIRPWHDYVYDHVGVELSELVKLWFPLVAILIAGPVAALTFHRVLIHVGEGQRPQSQPLRDSIRLLLWPLVFLTVMFLIILTLHLPSLYQGMPHP